LNGLDEASRFRLQRAFESTVVPFPSSPAALLDGVEPALLDAHAGNPEYAEHFAQSEPLASLFIELLADVRNEGVYRRTHLRLTEMRAVTRDYSSTTFDRAGGMARSGSWRTSR
jgi:hypothetical protein